MPLPVATGQAAMQKFWKYFKVAVLIWGFLSLAFVVFVAGWIVVEHNFRTVAQAPQEAGQVEPVLDKTFGELQLKITQTSGKLNTFQLSLVQAGKSLLTEYPLPLGDYGLDWISISDAKVVPLAAGAYRIMLYSSYGESEGSEGQIWLLKFDGQMRMVKLIQLADRHQLDDKETQLFGNVNIVLPAIGDADYYETMAVPTQISIGDEIRTTPMLDPQGRAMLRAHYEKRIAARMAKLTGPAHAELLAQYKKAAAELQSSLVPQVIPY